MRFVRRSPRKKLHCSALLTLPDEHQEIVDLVEISVHGAAFASAVRPPTGQRVSLLLDPGTLRDRGLSHGLPALLGRVINAARSANMPDGRLRHIVGIDFDWLPPVVVTDLRCLTDAPGPPGPDGTDTVLPLISHHWSFQDKELAYQIAYAAVEGRDFAGARVLISRLRAADPVNPSCCALEFHIAAEEALQGGALDEASTAVGKALSFMPHASDLGDLASRIAHARQSRPQRRGLLDRLFGTA